MFIMRAAHIVEVCADCNLDGILELSYIIIIYTITSGVSGALPCSLAISPLGRLLRRCDGGRRCWHECWCQCQWRLGWEGGGNTGAHLVLGQRVSSGQPWTL